LAAFAVFSAVVRVDLGRRYRDLRFKPILPTLAEVTGKVSRAIDYVVIPLAQAAVLNGTVLILGVMAGASAAPVVAFTTMRTLANVVRQVVNQAAQVTSTELTRLHAAGDRLRTERLYVASARFLGGAGGLMAGAVLAVAPDFLAIWTRGKVVYDAWAFAGLLGAIVLALPGHIAMVLLYTGNQPRALSTATAAFGLVGMVAAVPAAHWAGLVGVAWVLAAAELATIGLLPWQVARAMGLPALGPAVVAWGAAAAGFAIGFGVAFVELLFMSEKSINALFIIGVLWCGIVTLPACFLLLDGEGRRRVLGRIRGE
jgi:O-antigen/teichoic acid export membrane protein